VPANHDAITSFDHKTAHAYHDANDFYLEDPEDTSTASLDLVTPKETVKRQTVSTEATVILTAPLMDNSYTAASEGSPESTINNQHQNSGS
jgi:hypothetical protein